MSALTTIDSERIYWAVEQVERKVGDIDELHLDENEFYLKSEADEVIAEKDAEISELKENYRNLRRHLFKAGAKWAKQEKMRYTSNGMHKMAGAFENMERMCLEMVENLRKEQKADEHTQEADK